MNVCVCVANCDMFNYKYWFIDWVTMIMYVHCVVV